MHEVLGDFCSVTRHFGVRYESRWGKCMYVIYRSRKIRVGYEVAARLTLSSARKECRYLERLNYG